ncbi:RNA polymerase sigma factor, sigma-70 family [Natronincola peptidivorans]|uniref:RNA polymerase sigma factor, sigma-70 family n=1 Tax=Natronincola peptidivorans TaxID=426128 RepID=A0A1I0FCM6_9FIRM|nr:sigma factor-like helix-turn-helix DNA-binding protein [Natronincola peptidivorans]SET55905.1 RNA polymerase sigma factor, sigma-70 family [Natronincola peptidivorans]
MTKKDLQEYYWLQRNIQKLEDKLLELETKATKITTYITDEPKSTNNNSDKISNVVMKIIEVQQRINKQLEKSYEILRKIEEAIEILPERERYLIRLRYIDCKSWEQIAVDMNYSWQHIHKIHSDALKLLARKRCE